MRKQFNPKTSGETDRVGQRCFPRRPVAVARLSFILLLAFYSLDLEVMKNVSLGGKWEKYKLKLGLKFFNVTNHFNPRDFQNNLASTNFGAFSNGVGRRFATRFVIEKK